MEKFRQRIYKVSQTINYCNAKRDSIDFLRGYEMQYAPTNLNEKNIKKLGEIIDVPFNLKTE